METVKIKNEELPYIYADLNGVEYKDLLNMLFDVYEAGRISEDTFHRLSMYNEEILREHIDTICCVSDWAKKTLIEKYG